MVPTRRFTPFVQINDQASKDQMMARAPLISCSNRDAVQYGHSLLFVKPSSAATIYHFRVLVSARIEFYTFDGDDSQNVSSVSLLK